MRVRFSLRELVSIAVTGIFGTRAHEDRTERIQGNINLEGWGDPLMPTLDAVVQPSLNADFLETHAEGQSWSAQRLLPEKVLQFGEGGFLRGFVDWMIHGMNQKGLFGGRVVVVQPIGQGQIEKLNEQSGAYTLLMRGIEDGKVIERQELITSISRGINPYTHFQDYLRCAHRSEERRVGKEG